MVWRALFVVGVLGTGKQAPTFKINYLIVYFVVNKVCIDLSIIIFLTQQTMDMSSQKRYKKMPSRLGRRNETQKV